MSTAIYRESGSEAVVDVLSDEIVEGYRTVKLKCTEVRCSTPRCPIALGDEWEASSKPGFEIHAGWTLSPIRGAQ
jgi:hypothetical protein